MSKSIAPALNVDGSQNFTTYRGRHYISFAGYNLFQDQYSGALFYED